MSVVKGARPTEVRLPRRTAALVVVGIAGVVVSCAPERDMAERAEMPDTMEVKRALEKPRARDSMLDTLPGGEMARGDSTAAEQFLRDKMP